MRQFQRQKISEQQSNSGVYQVPDSVWFDHAKLLPFQNQSQSICGHSVTSFSDSTDNTFNASDLLVGYQKLI